MILCISGTMSGGGNKVVKGRMSSKLLHDVSPTQLASLEDKLTTEETKAQVCDHVTQSHDSQHLVM